MNLLVTGATGFIGRWVIPLLLKQGHRITAVARTTPIKKGLNWPEEIRFVQADIHHPQTVEKIIKNHYDAVIHLAWSDLDNYGSLSHFEQSLPAHYGFLKSLVKAGVRQILVGGTCFEYGLTEGRLDEQAATNPCIPYAVAKDSLRRFLQQLQSRHPFRLQWVRIFYLYGQGQNATSLIPLLDAAIDRGDPVFEMSAGDQLRDYLPVETAAAHLVTVLGHPQFDGIINLCSGQPVSIRGLVENRIARRKAAIKLNLGHYPYAKHEPMAFWGSTLKLEKLLNHPRGKK